MPCALPLLLALGLAQAEDVDPDAPVEVIVVQDAAEMRLALDQRLDELGFVHARRRGDRVVYRNRERWKPRVVVYDEGFVVMRDPPVAVDGIHFVPPLLFVVGGRIPGKRLRERAKAEIAQTIAPTVRSWQDAIAGEAGWDPDYEAPVLAVGALEARDLGELALAGVTGTHPQDWDPDQRRVLPADLERAARAWVDLEVAERYAPDPRVLEALRAVPRTAFIPPDVALEVGRGRPVGAPHGAWVATAGQVAWACKAARVVPGSRVLELGTEAGYQAAVLSRLGAEVHRVDSHPPRLERLTGLLAGLGLGVAVRMADPAQGWQEAGPFDAILVEVGLGVEPVGLADQLADRGVLLLLDQGRSTRLVRRGEELREDHMLDMTAPDLRWGHAADRFRVETPGP